jgi:hypothetical protein
MILGSIEDLAANHIIVLPQAGKVPVTVFVQAEKIADDNDQTAGAHGMAYPFKRYGQRFLSFTGNLIGLQPVHQSLDHPHCTPAATGRPQFTMASRREKKSADAVTAPDG